MATADSLNVGYKFIDMNTNFYSNITTNLIDRISFLKEQELRLGESKLLKLEGLSLQNPDNVTYQYRIVLIKQRLQHLKNTAYQLQNLKCQLKNK